MRPRGLNPLFAAITTLPGVGPRVEKLYRRLFGREQPARIIDLLFHLPTGVIDRRARPKLRDVVPDTVVTVAVTVDRHRPPPPYRPRAPYQVYTSDETGDLILTYFNARRDYLQKLLPEGLAWSRLAYDEFLAGQLALALVRAHLRRPAGRATPGTGQFRKKLIDALPYSLTPSQGRAVAEIVADLSKPERMLRLLQGDVGSGKTVVALLAAAAVIEGGRQAALMAPTEVLARQHFHTIAPLAAAADITLAILTGRARGRERSGIREKLALREIHVLVGSHALLQDQAAFRHLALAVGDEQHRFGVHQRLALAKKGEAVDGLA